METTAPAAAPTKSQRLWTGSRRSLPSTEPQEIHWCDGSTEEYEGLCERLVQAGTFRRLSRLSAPTPISPSSDPGDVARVEDRTFICSATEDGAGPTNNWRLIRRDAEALGELFAGSCGAARCTSCRSRWARLALTRATSACSSPDSTYVAVNMRIMTAWAAAPWMF